MIIVLSKDPDTIKSLFAVQANGAVATFGARSAVGLYNASLASNENLFLVADIVTFNASQAPAIGDLTGVWTVQQANALIEDVFPQTYGGNVYIASRQVDQRGSCWEFAGMLKTLLNQEVRMTGDVFFHPGALLGPVPAPGDTRWKSVQPIAPVASPAPVGPLEEGAAPTPMLNQAA